MIKQLSDLNPHQYPLTSQLESNGEILLEKVLALQTKYMSEGGLPFVVTSGLRSDAQQQALIDAGKSNAIHSKHLTFQAVDILDANRKLQNWITINTAVARGIGFWFEDFTSINRLAIKEHVDYWCHMQSVPPASGKLFFIP